MNIYLPRRHFLGSLAEFHASFEVSRFSPADHAYRLELVGLRATLIQEELIELLDADAEFRARPRDEKRTHVAKELADLVYVTVGTAEVFGLDFADPAVDADRALALPFSQLLPTIETLAREAERQLDDIHLLLITNADAEELDRAIDLLAPTLERIVRQCAVLAIHYRVPLRRVFDCVHESNMSKINPATGYPEYREDGKVLKGSWYRPADLGWLTSNLGLHPVLRFDDSSSQELAA